MAKTITITLKVVTPLFTGGVMQEEKDKGPMPELRAQTIKGLLRFWYRALHPPIPQQPEPWKEEFRIFGSTAGKGNQSVFRLSVDSEPTFEEPSPMPWPAALAYLGYGPVGIVKKKQREKQNLTGPNWVNVTRPWIRPCTEIHLNLRFGPRARPQDIDEVMQACWALCTFGGIGSRSRHGWGSVQLIRVSDPQYNDLTQNFRTEEELKAHITGNLGRFTDPASTQPSYTAFSADTRFILSPLRGTWIGTLQVAGSRMWNWRSLRSQQGAKNFRRDRDLIFDFLRGRYTKPTTDGSFETKISSFPTRVIFGLPHNYFFPSRPGRSSPRPNKAGVDAIVQQDQKKVEIGRRASPLLLTVKQIGGQHAALHTYLPADFLPNGAEIRLSPLDGLEAGQINKKGWDNEHLEESSEVFVENYRALEDYLTELTSATNKANAWVELSVFGSTT